MGLERTVRIARCLAATMSQLDSAAWPSLVERFQATMELTGVEGSLALSGRKLLLTADGSRQEILI